MATCINIPAMSPTGSGFALPSLQTAFSSPSSVLYPPSPSGSPASSLGKTSRFATTPGSVSFQTGGNKENFSYSHSVVGGMTRDERPNHEGPGTAVYVRQPTRSQLKAAAVGLFESPYKPYYFADPSGKPFIDVDGRDCGPRWILVDPSGGRKLKKDGSDDGKGCCIM